MLSPSPRPVRHPAQHDLPDPKEPHAQGDTSEQSVPRVPCPPPPWCTKSPPPPTRPTLPRVNPTGPPNAWDTAVTHCAHTDGVAPYAPDGQTGPLAISSRAPSHLPVPSTRPDASDLGTFRSPPRYAPPTRHSPTALPPLHAPRGLVRPTRLTRANLPRTARPIRPALAARIGSTQPDTPSRSDRAQRVPDSPPTPELDRYARILMSRPTTATHRPARAAPPMTKPTTRVPHPSLAERTLLQTSTTGLNLKPIPDSTTTPPRTPRPPTHPSCTVRPASPGGPGPPA